MDKKKHIVILVDSYFPNMTMNGVVAKRINDVIEQKNDVSIITYVRDKKDNKSNLHYIFFWSVYFENILAQKIRNSSNKVSSIFWKICMKMKRVLSFSCRNRNLLGINKGVVKKILKELVRLNETFPIDKVISIAAPFEFQMANYWFSKQNPQIENIVYQIDYWIMNEEKKYPLILQEKRKHARIVQQKEIAKHCKVYMLPFIYENEGKLLTGVDITPCQLPLLVKNDEYNSEEDGDEETGEYDFVFAGSLNMEDRNPQKLIAIINRLNEKKISRIHFYHRGNCAGYICEMSKKIPGVIIDHGTVPSNVAYLAMVKADILVSIGINTGDQIAGKTFDYISTGKRIVYIYFSETDINADFLKRYPLALCLNVNKVSIEECADRLLKFIEESKKRISFSEVVKLYGDALPEKTCQCLFGVEICDS